jgi:hypothetical protein
MQLVANSKLLCARCLARARPPKETLHSATDASLCGRFNAGRDVDYLIVQAAPLRRKLLSEFELKSSELHRTPRPRPLLPLQALPPEGTSPYSAHSSSPLPPAAPAAAPPPIPRRPPPPPVAKMCCNCTFCMATALGLGAGALDLPP